MKKPLDLSLNLLFRLHQIYPKGLSWKNWQHEMEHYTAWRLHTSNNMSLSFNSFIWVRYQPAITVNVFSQILGERPTMKGMVNSHQIVTCGECNNYDVISQGSYLLPLLIENLSVISFIRHCTAEMYSTVKRVHPLHG